MKKILFLSLSIMGFIISGCSGKKPMYEYSNYSETYYQLKQNGDAESSAKWKTSLEESIAKSNARAIRVPPGIYANLGYLYLKVNDIKKAISFFEAEKALYPEASMFMDNLIKKAELMQEGRNEL